MHYERSETYRVPPERLWPLIANTESLNREMGMAEVDYSFTPLAQGGSTVTGSARSASLPMEWEEHPWEWVWPKRYALHRVFTRGPFHEMRVLYEITPEGQGCRVKVSADLEPAGIIGRLIASRAGKSGGNQIFEALKNFEKYLLGEAATPYPKRFAKASVDVALLDSAVRRLKEFPVDAALADRLGQLVAHEVDERVRDLQPFALADEWRADRLAVLRLCLWATRAGLLDLRWHVTCPVCHGSKGEHDTMRKLSTQHECASCNLKFKVNLDERVEARFTPNAAIRSVNTGLFCMIGPMNTPHIAAQVTIPPGESRPVDLDLPPGRYLVRRGGAMEAVPLKLGDGPAEATVGLRSGADGQGSASMASKGRLTLKNEMSAPIRVSVERTISDEPATAAWVTSLQEFRDLFSGEALAAGTELSIGSLALLFSDLKDSTAMYERIGDAPAYGIVRRHFEFMIERIKRHNGALVKTMGDAVMAVFRAPADAIRCALAIQKERPKDDVPIKLGIHAGACIAVTSADYLDYFGSVVNIAARAQAQSVGDDVVITDAVMRSPGVDDEIRKAGAHESRFTATLKGLEGPFQLHRLVFGRPGETMIRTH